MEIHLDVLLIILGTGLVTLIPRVLPLVLLSKINLPGWFLTWLRFIPVTVMTALLTEELFVKNHHISLLGRPFELIAIIPSFLAAIFFRSLLGTVVVGVVSVALLRTFFG